MPRAKVVDSVRDLAAAGLHLQLLCGIIPYNSLNGEDIKSSIGGFLRKIGDGEV